MTEPQPGIKQDAGLVPDPGTGSTTPSVPDGKEDVTFNESDAKEVDGEKVVPLIALVAVQD